MVSKSDEDQSENELQLEEIVFGKSYLKRKLGQKEKGRVQKTQSYSNVEEEADETVSLYKHNA
jgi:hypothetical protein